MFRSTAVLVASIALAVVGCSSSGAPAGEPSPSGPPSQAQVTAQPSPPTKPAASGAPIKVVDVVLRADPVAHVGKCPVEITFSGAVSVTGGPGTVTYRWVSSDGDRSPSETLKFDGPGSKEVSSTWIVDPVSMPTHAGWSSIEIVEPSIVLASAAGAAADSSHADFSFTCDTDADVESIAFGLTGSDADCAVDAPSHTFAPADPIHMVATYSPALSAGTMVTVRLTRGDILVDGYPVTIPLDVATKCVFGSVTPGTLPAGHYRLDVIPDTARAVTGEFDTK